MCSRGGSHVLCVKSESQDQGESCVVEEGVMCQVSSGRVSTTALYSVQYSRESQV